MSANSVVAGAGSDDDDRKEMKLAIPSSLDPANMGKLVWCSYVPATNKEKGALMNALSGQLPKLSTLINTEIEVSNVIFQGAQFTNEQTGEIEPGVRSILVLKDGRMYTACSDGIRGCLGMIFQLFSRPPWNPPMRLAVKQLDIGHNRRWFTLEYAGK